MSVCPDRFTSQVSWRRGSDASCDLYRDGSFERKSVPSALAGAAKLRAVPAADSSCIPPLLTSHLTDRVVIPVDPRRLFPNDPSPFQLQSSDKHARPYILKI